jgi:hypothetical protein
MVGCLFLASANQYVIRQPLYRKAARVRIGSSQEAVIATLGQPTTWTSRPGSTVKDGYYYGPLQSWWDWQVVSSANSLLSRWGISLPAYCRPDDYPVVVSFGPDQRVSRIRYGKTVINKY